MTKELKLVLEDKENDLRLAKERAVQEYRDSDALLSELRVSYNDGFDECIRFYPLLVFVLPHRHLLSVDLMTRPCGCSTVFAL